jgi:hypothetical protein
MRGRTRSTGVIAATLALLASLALAADAPAFIYWADSQNDRIGRAENDGSGVNPNFIQTGGLPIAVAVDSTYVYWANQGSGTIGRASIDGSGVDNSFITGIDLPSGVAVNATSIFWSSLEGEIGKANIDGSNPKPSLITDPTQACGVALDSGHVYWADQAGAPSYIGRAGLDGSSKQPTYVTIPGISFPCGVAVNSSNIFWADFGFVGPGTRIGRANTSTGDGADASFIGDASGPCGVALFSSQLYWANFATGTIARANTDGTGVNQGFFNTGTNQICGPAIDGLSSPPLPPQPQPPAAGPPADTAAPATTIVKGPGKGVAQGKAKFSFRSSEKGSTFRCKLDARKVSGCKSPKTYAGLKPGRHVFKVWAVDPAGNQDPTAAKRRFRIPSPQLSVR